MLVYVLIYPDTPLEIATEVLTGKTLIEYAEERRQDILKCADGEDIGWHKITDEQYAVEFFRESMGYTVNLHNVK